MPNTRAMWTTSTITALVMGEPFMPSCDKLSQSLLFFEKKNSIFNKNMRQFGVAHEI